MVDSENMSSTDSSMESGTEEILETGGSQFWSPIHVFNFTFNLTCLK
jgi:hypothetical protein